MTSEAKKGREPSLAVQSLQPRGEYRRAGRLAVAHLPVALDRVDTRTPRPPLAAVVIAHAVPGLLPLVPRPGLLEQGLGQQAAALVIPATAAVCVFVLVKVGGLHEAMLHLGAHGSGPGVPVAIMPGHGVGAGVSTREQGRGESPGPDPFCHRRIVIRLPLLVVGK